MYLYFLNTQDGTRSKRAQVDGYAFGDRMLEGVMFDIYVNYDGTLKAEMLKNAINRRINFMENN